MLQRRIVGFSRRLPSHTPSRKLGQAPIRRAFATTNSQKSDYCIRHLLTRTSWRFSQSRDFHVVPTLRAQTPTADALMDNLTDLYSTAKDEFEIAAEETEKKTVYAADDREAAKQALNTLREAYERAIKESDPDVAKEVQSRTGPRIRELENAVTAMEEMAMED